MHCWPFPETPQGASFKSVTRDGAHGRGCEVARVGSEPARAGVCVPRDWASALRGRERLRAQAGARAQAANAIPRPAGRQAGRRCLQVALGAWRGVFQSQTLIPNPSELEPLARAIRLLSGGRWGGWGSRAERAAAGAPVLTAEPAGHEAFELASTGIKVHLSVFSFYRCAISRVSSPGPPWAVPGVRHPCGFQRPQSSP